MRILCAYYSWQGHTAKVAKRLSDMLHAELVRIEEEKESGIFGKGMKAALGMRAPIRAIQTDLSLIDVLVIASPVWAHKVPPYINEYISQLTNCRGKHCYVLVEMGGSGAGKAIAHLKARLEMKEMKFSGSIYTLEKDVDSGAFDDSVRKFSESILSGSPDL
jgi:flavodoxin